jgi:hypothetical protein
MTMLAVDTLGFTHCLVTLAGGSGSVRIESSADGERWDPLPGGQTSIRPERVHVVRVRLTQRYVRVYPLGRLSVTPDALIYPFNP